MGIPAVLVMTIVSFDIEPGPAEDVLLEWSVQAHVDFGVSPRDVQGVHLVGVHGKMDARAALRTLLAGTGFTYAVTGDWTVDGDGRAPHYTVYRIPPCDPNAVEPPLPPCTPLYAPSWPGY